MPDDALDPATALPPEVSALATEALAGEPAERAAAFAAVCEAHPEHAAALQRMFADLLAMERLLGGDAESDSQAPHQIGPYRVLRRLGGGAFGEVFHCEQEEPVRREVAVKVLRAGVGDRTTLLRFAAERQLIASLQHPAIAQVFDAGTLTDGRPFFVMDAIDGAPIDRWCDEHALAVEARLELFADLCRGVQHAHERGIVHRDLKPANVLVVEIDGRPRPKIIDFGIAKALHTSRVQRSFDTEAGRVIGTPGYMSPEQQRGSSDDVDARADVFGLGVILYQLLCGELPWPAGSDSTDSDPQRPSTRVSASASTAAAIARQRSTEPRRLASRLRGEIDWIVLQCLQREPARRYQSTRALLDDLERHRRSEPVHARPPSASYRLRKFVRRHRTGAVAIASLCVVLAIGAVVTQQYRHSVGAEIGAATARADASFAAATAAVALLVERSRHPSVREAPQGDAAREAMLRDAVSFYDRFLRDRPADAALLVERCRALIDLSHVYWLLGDAPRATEFAAQAMQDGEAAFAAEPTSTERRGWLGVALCRHGVARVLANDPADAMPSFRTAIEHLGVAAAASPARFGNAHVSALRGAAAALPAKANDERVAAMRVALRAADALRTTAAGAAAAQDFVLCSCDLANNLGARHAASEADAVLVAAQDVLADVGDERLHMTCRVATLRARLAFQSGERTEAIEHYRTALTAIEAWQRAWPQRLLPRLLHCRTLRGLGHAQNYVGEFAASETSFRRAIELGEEVAAVAESQGIPDLIQVLEEFAVTLFDRFRHGSLAEAAHCIDRAVTLAAGRAAVAEFAESSWRRLALQAAIADSAAVDGGDARWPAVEAALPVNPLEFDVDKDRVLGAWAGLARWHLDHGRDTAADAALAKAEAWIARDPEYHAKRTVEVVWLTARRAAKNGDHAACAAAADRVLAARSSWYGRRRSADCLHLAWRITRAVPSAEALATMYCERALASYRQVIESLDADVANEPSDPWYVLPWAFASVRAAELSGAAGDSEAATRLLAAALPRLDAVRADAHADQWDEAAYRDGRAQHEQLTAGR